jgi:hypothetical protein
MTDFDALTPAEIRVGLRALLKAIGELPNEGEQAEALAPDVSQAERQRRTLALGKVA